MSTIAARQDRLSAWKSRKTAIAAASAYQPTRDRFGPVMLSPTTSARYSSGICSASSRWVTSATTSARSRDGTDATTSRLRETASRGIATCSGPIPTVAMSPSRTWPPLGVSINRSANPDGLCRTAGPPQTTTSNTFCSSYRLPTSRPEIRVAASRRTSPGLSPNAPALARSTSIRTVGCTGCASTRGETTPRTVPSVSATDSAVRRSWSNWLP